MQFGFREDRWWAELLALLVNINRTKDTRSYSWKEFMLYSDIDPFPSEEELAAKMDRLLQPFELDTV